jgi:hypothetical protein
MRSRASRAPADAPDTRSCRDGYNACMNNSPAPDTTLSDDDVHACVRVLRAVETDRSHLTRLTPESRRELLTLAGLVAKPERHDVTRMGKAFRRAKREATRVHDRRVMEQAGQRIQRRSAVYAPLWRRTLLALPGREAAAVGLPSQQRMPDRASTGRFLPASPCQRSTIGRRAPRGLARSARESR